MIHCQKVSVVCSHDAVGANESRLIDLIVCADV